MSRLFIFLMTLCVMVGCRSSKSVSSSMEQHATSTAVSTSDSVGISIASQLQRMMADGTLSARIIRFYPSDTLSHLVIPDQPLPSSTPLPLSTPQASSDEQPASTSMPWLLPFGQVSSITDIHFNGHLQQESGSSHLNASARNDSINEQKDIDVVSSSSKATKSDGLPWYKQVIIFLFAVMFCGGVTLLFYKRRP